MISKKTNFKPAILGVQHLTKTFGNYPVFQNLNFEVNAGEKIALVGINGAGKSTLLKIIGGQDSADSGLVTTQAGLQIAYLAQEPNFELTNTLYTEMLTAFAELHRLVVRLQQLEAQLGALNAASPDWANLLEQYSLLTAQFEIKGGYDYETRIQQILTGLGFDEEWWPRPLAQFSGGQLTRAALARTLLAQPDLLLLDEPTNHLDLPTLEWLEKFLASWKGTLIVISHDRLFLDRVVSRVLDLSDGKLHDYPGNYSRYQELRLAQIERANKEFIAQQKVIAKNEEFVRRYRAGSRAQEAQSRQKALDRMARTERPREHSRMRVELQTYLQSGRIVLATHNLTIGWQNGATAQPLFTVPDLVIERGERIAITGPNGSGKTTLLKTIVGELAPLAGTIETGIGVKIAYYSQTHASLGAAQTVLQEIRQTYPLSEEDARTVLGRFLFRKEDVFKRVGQLSGGERSRLVLAKITLAKANLLVLDEPTNHLDIYARESLENLLVNYDGTILLVSHDRYLINRLATQVWQIDHNILALQRNNYNQKSQKSEKAFLAGK